MHAHQVPALNTAGTVTISAQDLRALVCRMLAAGGVPSDAAARVADGLVEADLEGAASHGVMLLDMYLERIRRGSVSTKTLAEVVSDRSAAVTLDAAHALGQLTGEQAIELAIERARQFGAGIVAVRHAFHFGTARRYAQLAAAAGCIGIAMCNTRPLMPAPGGTQRAVGNNPIAIALPVAGSIPLVLDMATSEAAMGKIRMAEKAHRPIPGNWAVTAEGLSTTDATEAIAGMLLPTGGAKGFGLAFVIDLMCGLLSGGSVGQEVRPLYGDPSLAYDCSHLFMAIDVAHFCDPEEFRARAGAAAERIRAGRRPDTVERLFAPGEPEWRRHERAAGEVELAPEVAKMLVRLARELGVSAEPLHADLKPRESGHAQA
ncbi:MAG: Ldh family oxidoreductase [Alphaproteobacteria bacterium]|nr:MAG: Ldh family oxidoreductase [Alphaproteobacteria bacterium]